jgi:hypothetical protein
VPEARIGDVIAALAGDLALVPWAWPWRPASARAAGDWRSALGPAPLEELQNRAFFGSVGTGDDSSPFPQARALPLTCCSCLSLFAMPYGPAGTGKAAAEQSLLDEAMGRFPALFSPDWICLMDRNYRAPRGVLAYRPRSGHRREEVSVGLMAYPDP